jgi:hypothetical protein
MDLLLRLLYSAQERPAFLQFVCHSSCYLNLRLQVQSISYEIDIRLKVLSSTRTSRFIHLE